MIRTMEFHFPWKCCASPTIAPGAVLFPQLSPCLMSALSSAFGTGKRKCLLCWVNLDCCGVLDYRHIVAYHCNVVVFLMNIYMIVNVFDIPQNTSQKVDFLVNIVQILGYLREKFVSCIYSYGVFLCFVLFCSILLFKEMLPDRSLLFRR